MNNILITSAGKRVSLLNAFKKELKAIFLIKSFATDYNPQLSAACMPMDGLSSKLE
jgi:carbamoyl-phosphate synthase large subunit